MTNDTTATAHLCDACVHVALGGLYAGDLAAAMGAEYVAGKRAALDALGTITSDVHAAPRVNHVLTPCAACGARVNDTTIVDYLPAAPAAHWEDALTATDTAPAPRYAVTTNHPDARAPYAYADTRTEAIRLAHELHGLRATRAANGLLTGAVLVRDTEHAYGGAFIFRIDTDGTARAL